MPCLPTLHYLMGLIPHDTRPLSNIPIRLEKDGKEPCGMRPIGSPVHQSSAPPSEIRSVSPCPPVGPKHQTIGCGLAVPRPVWLPSIIMSFWKHFTIHPHTGILDVETFAIRAFRKSGPIMHRHPLTGDSSRSDGPPNHTPHQTKRLRIYPVASLYERDNSTNFSLLKNLTYACTHV